MNLQMRAWECWPRKSIPCIACEQHFGVNSTCVKITYFYTEAHMGMHRSLTVLAHTQQADDHEITRNIIQGTLSIRFCYCKIMFYTKNYIYVTDWLPKCIFVVVDI